MDQHVEGAARKRARLRAPERRETILRAAAEVFGQAGYRAGKVSDVAARVGVTEPVIFQNFGSKAALFAAVLERAAADVQASLDDLAAGFGSASGLLAHVLTGLAHGRPGQTSTDQAARPAGAGHPGAGYGVLFADAATLAAEPELSQSARTAIRAVAAHLAAMIQRAQASGLGSPGRGPAPGWPWGRHAASTKLRAGMQRELSSQAFPNSLRSCSQKAGRSPGLRLVMSTLGPDVST
jgi:AcrR family transcriptional regulator